MCVPTVTSGFDTIEEKACGVAASPDATSGTRLDHRYEAAPLPNPFHLLGGNVFLESNVGVLLAAARRAVRPDVGKFAAGGQVALEGGGDMEQLNRPPARLGKKLAIELGGGKNL